VYFIVTYSQTHQAQYGAMANQITGKINSQYSNIRYYFQLKSVNDSLVKANMILYNKLRQNDPKDDSTAYGKFQQLLNDSTNISTNRFSYVSARIVSNSVNTPNNFMVLEGGSDAGFHIGMGVIDAGGGVLGIITQTSKDYSVVMSLLHKDSRISGKILKTGETGTVVWDGKETNVLYMNGISKSVKVAKGDSIITSGFSTTFPKGLLIGRVEGVYDVENTNFIKIKIQTQANFYNAQYGYVLESKDAAEINSLLKSTIKQMQ
jgi:rod shape-determining protein MreC